MRFFLFSLLTITFLSVLPMQAKADYNVWQDPGTGLSMSWPDTWKRVSNADPDDIVTVMAPSGRAHAACRVRVRDDARYLIYPPRYSWAAQKVSYSFSFWDQYFAEYDEHELYNVRDSAGLGRGFAGYAAAGYESAVQGPYMSRKALAFASLYNGRAYILECSSHADAFNDWKGMFLSIAGSIDFKKAHNELFSGHYRYFAAERRIELEGYKGKSKITY